jgi:hypothetical protein
MKRFGFNRVSVIYEIYAKYIRNICELVIYADDFHILGGSIRTIKENADDLVVASREIGLEVNADKTKCMVMSRNQNARRSHSIKNDNSSLEKVEQFRYVRTCSTNLSSFGEKFRAD